MRALAEHALLLSEAEYRSVHRELDAGDAYHRHLGLHYATVRRDIPEVIRAVRDPVLRRRALSAAMRLRVPDEVLVELVDTGPRRDRRLVYGLLKRSLRRTLADALLPKVFERRGRVEASRLLPACSPAVVAEWLPRTGADQSVLRQLARTAPKAVLAFLDAQPPNHRRRKPMPLLESLALREPVAVAELVTRHPDLCRSARLAMLVRQSTSDFKAIWRSLDFREKVRVLAALPPEERRDLVDENSSVDMVALLPLEERRAVVADRGDLLAALPFEEVSERLLEATTSGVLRERAAAWENYVACAERTGDRAVFADAVARTERAWLDGDLVRAFLLNRLAQAPKRLLDAVPSELWQRMIRAISSALDNSERTRRALRRLSERLGVLEPEHWEVVARRRTDLVGAVLDTGWPGPTRWTGRWTAAQQARYEEQAICLAMDDAAEMSARVAAAKMIRDQAVLVHLLDRAPQPLALAALRGITSEHVLVRCVQAWRGPISRVAGRMLADLVDGSLTAISVGGTKEQARLLAETRPPDAVDRLLALWRHAHRDIKVVAAASLVTFLGEDPRVSTVVSEALVSEDAATRQAVLGKPPIPLTPRQSVLFARLLVEALPHGAPDVIIAYAAHWRLAPDGLDAVVELISQPYDQKLVHAVMGVLHATADTEAGDRVMLAVLDRAAGRWLRDFWPLARGRRSVEVIRGFVEAFRRAGLNRLAAEVLQATAVRTLDVAWWRELVEVVGDRADRLTARDIWRPHEWREAAAIDIFDELIATGGYVPARLALVLARIGGLETEWAAPWRARIEELRSHRDVDIRELATAVRTPLA